MVRGDGTRRAGAWRARLRWGAPLLAALALNAALLLVLGSLPLRLPPRTSAPVPIELVSLPAPPDPVSSPAPPAPEPDAPPAAAPAPPPARRPPAPAADLPEAAGTSGVVALDCNAVFDEEGRVVACAGGDVTLGYEVDGAAWDAIAAGVPRYGPEGSGRPSGLPEGPGRYAVDGRRAPLTV